MVFLRTFGGLSLTGDTGSAEASVNGTRLSLLAFLAAHGDRGVRRDRILLTFWGDSDQEHARNSLKQAVFALRRYSGRSDLLLGVDELRINPEALSADVTHFRAALEADRLDEAVKSYTGDFLEGVHVKAAAEFEQWRHSQQTALRDEYQSALRRLAQRADSSNLPDDAIRYWKLLKASAPLDSRVALDLAKALNAAGDRAGAMISAREHEATLHRELGLATDPEFGRAVSAILASARTTEEQPAPQPRRSPLSSDTAPLGATLPPAVPGGGARKPRYRAWRIVAGASGAALAAFALFYANQRHTRPKSTLVIAFDNKTGDASLDAFGSLLADWTASQIAASGATSVTPSMNTLSTAPGSARKMASADLAMKAVTSDEFAYAVGGSFYRSNDSITIEPVVVSSRTRSMLASLRPVRVAAAEMDRAAEQVAQMVTGAIATEIDERISTLRTASESAPRYDAYAQFIQGIELFHDDQRKAAFDAFSRARALDSSFVLPILWQAFAIPGGRQIRDSLSRVLESYAQRLSPLERYGAAFLRADLDDDQPAALRNARRASALAPGSYWSFQAARKLSLYNRDRQALKVLSTIQPETWVGNWPGFWRYYIATAHRTGDDALASRLVKRASVFGVSRLVLLRFHAMLEAAGGSESGVIEDYKAYAAITPSPDSLMLFFAIVANEAAYHRHPALRNELGDSLIRYVAAPGDTTTKRVGLLADAYSTVGRDREAWPYALRYRARSEDSVWAMGLLGVIAARSNRRAVALAYSDSLASRHSDGKGQATLSRARIAAALHDTAAAMHLIRQASAERSQVMWQHDSDFEELRGYSDYENLRNPEGAPRKRGTLASLLARSR